MRNRLIALVALAAVVLASPSYAGHHLWRLTELFSNASGTVQFIELFCPDANEQGVGPFQLGHHRDVRLQTEQRLQPLAEQCVIVGDGYAHTRLTSKLPGA